MSQIVLLIVDGKEYVELPLSVFDKCEGGAPFVGMKFYILTERRSEYSASKSYGPNIEVTEVMHGKFRDTIPPEVNDVFTEILDREGYLVKAKTFETPHTH